MLRCLWRQPQAMREAEARLSANLGNLDIPTVAGPSRADKTAMWILLKVLPSLTHTVCGEN